MKQTVNTFICFLFVFGLPGNLVTHYVYVAGTVVDKSGTILQASSGQAKNRSVAQASDNYADLSAFDLTEDDADTVHLAGLDIHDESRKLSMKMHHLSNEELRVTFVQVQLSCIIDNCVKT